MVHLVIYLVKETQMCGPTYMRWMYPAERYMKILKGYVKNRSCPEGCIVEQYIIEEAVEFCIEYLSNVQSIGLPIMAGKIHRGFRAFLSNKFLRDAEEIFLEAEHPNAYANLISPEEWESFKSKRRTPELQEVSDVYPQRASNPVYPYKKGRTRYEFLQQRILQEEKNEQTSLPPHFLWKAARVGKDGVAKEDVQQVFEQCLREFISIFNSS